MSYRILLTILFLTFSFAQDDCDGNFVDCLQNSSEQAAYYFSAVTLDGETLTSTDVIIAKNEESGRVVGYGFYENVNSGYTQVFVYGEMVHAISRMFW